MNYREKKPLFDKLKGEKHLTADKALLTKLNPAHKLLHTAHMKAEKNAARNIIFHTRPLQRGRNCKKPNPVCHRFNFRQGY